MKIAVLLTSLLPLSLIAAPPPETWTFVGSGNWGLATNWNPNAIPNAQDQTVTIGSAVQVGTSTITLDTLVAPSVTVGTMNLQSTNANGYVIVSMPATTNSITFNVSTGNALINVPVANAAVQTISAPLVLTSPLTITQNSAQNLVLSGGSTGGSSLTSSGTGNVVLSGTNSFTGGLVVTAGTVLLNQAGTLPATGSVTMTGGTLNLQSNAQTIGALSGTGPVMLGTAPLTINTTGNTSYGGNISGSGSLIIGGTGSLTLTTVNGYNGGTTINAGSLILGIDNAVNSAMTVNSPGVLNLNNFNLTVSQLSGSGSVALGTSTTNNLTIQGPNSTIFSGSISGSENFVQNGTSTITLSGTNSYSGTTTINGGGVLVNTSSSLPFATTTNLTGNGILALNNGISLTVGTLSATGGAAQVQLGSGQLIVAPTANANFAGVISGAGSVVFQGPFVWTIQTQQTYTGGTTINGGTMQMGIANALAPTDPVTVNSPGILNLFNFPLTIASLSGNGAVALGTGALTLNTSATTTFSGSISGAGSLVVQGSGTQILSGTNFYTGGTTVQGTATLQGTTSSLQGAIVNNSILFINQGFNGTYAGPLSGTGQLRVGGGATVTLSGTPSQGSATVLSGEMDIALGATLTTVAGVTVNSGATLGGSGTIVGTVSNFGSIEPSNILTVTGNVTFHPGSTFTADITPATSDRLNAGSVNIDPNSAVVVNVAPGIYQLDNFYTIIASGSPVVGQFQATELSNPFLSANLLYNQVPPGSVTMSISINSLSNVIKGGNAGAIAQCISRANMAIDRDLESLVSQMVFFSVDQVRDILDEMQPSQLRALTVAEQNNNFFAQQALNWRMAEFDRTSCEKEIGKNFPWNFWLSLAGNYNDQRPDDHNVGFRAPQVGFTAGFDGKVRDNLFLGVAAEYGHVWLDWKEHQGFSNINRIQAGPYLSYVGRFGFINASVMGAFAVFNAERHIPQFDRTAKSKHHGESLLPHLDAGVVLHPAPNVSITPFAAIDFLYGWEDSFKESGADSLDFSIASSSSRMYRSEVGLKISKCAVRSHTKWVHDLKASWVREERYKGESLTATFKQFPCTFKVKGLYPSRSLLDVGMGLTFIFKHDRFAATLRYEGQFGEAVSIQSGIGQLLTRF